MKDLLSFLSVEHSGVDSQEGGAAFRGQKGSGLWKDWLAGKELKGLLLSFSQSTL